MIKYNILMLIFWLIKYNIGLKKLKLTGTKINAPFYLSNCLSLMS